MRIAMAALLVAHGLAHLVGFFGSWHLLDESRMPYSTTVFAGHVDVGDAGIRVIGIFWALVGLAFAVAATGLLLRASWWLPLTVSVVGASLILCAAGWPAARIGVFVNVGILAILAAAMAVDWAL